MTANAALLLDSLFVTKSCAKSGAAVVISTNRERGLPIAQLSLCEYPFGQNTFVQVNPTIGVGNLLASFFAQRGWLFSCSFHNTNRDFASPLVGAMGRTRHQLRRNSKLWRGARRTSFFLAPAALVDRQIYVSFPPRFEL